LKMKGNEAEIECLNKSILDLEAKLRNSTENIISHDNEINALNDEKIF